MAYDAGLAELIRRLVASEPGLTEKKMFGGLAFLIGGNMAVAASGQGGLMVRVDPEETESLLASGKAHMIEMRGHTMPGWLRIATADVADDDELAQWVKLGLAYAGSLPAK